MGPEDSKELEQKTSQTNYSSRKFWMTIAAMGLIVSAGVASHFLPGMAVSVTSIIGGLVTALGLYHGANVSTKWTASNAVKTKGAPKETAPKKTGTKGR